MNYHKKKNYLKFNYKVAPTILDIMNLELPSEMTLESMIEK
ncbi:hypothetical protein [Mycoplasma yeatsii]|nr:hypothetical protein [Mycoplasma yeatsii]